jgi:hypothetical protein
LSISSKKTEPENEIRDSHEHDYRDEDDYKLEIERALYGDDHEPTEDDRELRALFSNMPLSVQKLFVKAAAKTIEKLGKAKKQAAHVENTHSD